MLLLNIIILNIIIFIHLSLIHIIYPKKINTHLRESNNISPITSPQIPIRSLSNHDKSIYISHH